MAKKRGGHGGGHGWFVTFADLMALMMSFFVMLVAFSTQDKAKMQIVAGSMRDAFGVQTVKYNGIVEQEGLPTRRSRTSRALRLKTRRIRQVRSSPTISSKG